MAWYRAELRPLARYHGRAGTVEAVAAGPGPISALVLFDCGDQAVAPRGQLIRETAARRRAGA